MMGLPSAAAGSGVIPASDCSGNYPGYKGLGDINDLTDASSLISTRAPDSGKSVYFATKAVEGCNNEGIHVFSQTGRYGVSDFVLIDGSKPWIQVTPWILTIDRWLGDSGVTDFSQAPDNP